MANINVLANIDLKKNQLLNAVLQNLAVHPSTTNLPTGFLYYNTTDQTVFTWTGVIWLDLGYLMTSTYTPVNETLNGAEVVATFQTDSQGNVLDFTTRLLTLADLGFTGSSNANYYVHPTFTNASTGNLTGATVIQSVTVNNEGHLTGITTRNLTASDIGAAAAIHGHTLSQITDVTATASELNVLDLSGVTGSAAGWVYRFDSATTASWGKLKGSEITNDIGWVVIDDNAVSNTKTYSSDKIETLIDEVNINIGNAVTGALINQGGFTPTTTSTAPTPVTSPTTKNGMVWVFTGVNDFDWNGTKVDSGDMLVANRDNADPTYPNHWTIVNKNIPAILDATTLVKGLVMLASAAEVQAGTDNTKAITPLGLASRTATETRTGIAEVATQSETNTGTDDERMVTPKKLKAFFDAAVGGMAANFGDGSATSFDIVHGLGTTDVTVQISENATGDEVWTAIKRVGINTVRVSVNNPPTMNEYRVIIKK